MQHEDKKALLNPQDYTIVPDASVINLDAAVINLDEPSSDQASTSLVAETPRTLSELTGIFNNGQQSVQINPLIPFRRSISRTAVDRSPVPGEGYCSPQPSPFARRLSTTSSTVSSILEPDIDDSKLRQKIRELYEEYLKSPEVDVTPSLSWSHIAIKHRLLTPYLIEQKSKYVANRTNGYKIIMQTLKVANDYYLKKRKESLIEFAFANGALVDAITLLEMGRIPSKFIPLSSQDTYLVALFLEAELESNPGDMDRMAQMGVEASQENEDFVIKSINFNQYNKYLKDQCAALGAPNLLFLAAKEGYLIEIMNRLNSHGFFNNPGIREWLSAVDASGRTLCEYCYHLQQFSVVSYLLSNDATDEAPFGEHVHKRSAYFKVSNSIGEVEGLNLVKTLILNHSRTWRRYVKEEGVQGMPWAYQAVEQGHFVHILEAIQKQGLLSCIHHYFQSPHKGFGTLLSYTLQLNEYNTAALLVELSLFDANERTAKGDNLLLSALKIFANDSTALQYSDNLLKQKYIVDQLLKVVQGAMVHTNLAGESVHSFCEANKKQKICAYVLNKASEMNTVVALEPSTSPTITATSEINSPGSPVLFTGRHLFSPVVLATGSEASTPLVNKASPVHRYH